MVPGNTEKFNEKENEVKEKILALSLIVTCLSVVIILSLKSDF